MGKLICERVVPFHGVPRQLWIQFDDIAHYRLEEKALMDVIRENEGQDSVVLYLKKEKAKKILPANNQVNANQELLDRLTKKLGEKNVKLVEKGIEKQRKMI